MALSAPPIERKRVKVYELRENDWFDRGTGFCTTQCILVSSLSCPLAMGGIAHRQGTIPSLPAAGTCADSCFHSQEEGRIFVESEEDSDRILLEVKIKKEDVYQKQQGWSLPGDELAGYAIDDASDTLIVWTDNDGVDMALSFQEAEGCSAVWYEQFTLEMP